jgi:thiol-disulfide isomerase/thioredoxin
MARATSPNKVKRQISSVIAALIVLAFAAIIVAKQGPSATADIPAAPAATRRLTEATGGPSSSHADAMVAYEAALKTGKPIYLLFHSLTCDPCIEISAVVDKVIPDYEDKVVFVNAISDDEASQQLAARFQFQYIPTSFFIDSKGTVVESYTGVIDEASMKTRLDQLAAR